MAIDEQRIAKIVQRVIENLNNHDEDGASTPARSSAATDQGKGDWGVFKTVDEAMKATAAAQKQLAGFGLDKRKKLIDAIRDVAIERAEEFARWIHDETRLGRYEDKVQKQINAARLSPGVEELRSDLQSNQNGVAITERGPYGVIVAIMPTTHPIPVLINNAIIMLAGGNTVFSCPHPRAENCTRRAMQIFNQAIVKAGGPENCLVALDRVSLDLVDEACKHPTAELIAAAGGPAVIEAALSSGKKAVAAGPGNPPVLVDETADIEKAGTDIVAGHSFDNNILCIAEKTCFVVDSVADSLIKAMQGAGAYLLAEERVQALTQLVTEDGHVNRDFVGQNASVILKELGITAGDDVPAIIMEVDVDNPLVNIEQMMPVLPVVRVPNFATGLEASVRSEQGFHHSAMIHSTNINRISAFNRQMGTVIVVVNAPSFAGLGVDGIGVFGHTIASPTGDGICTPTTFTRQRNLSVCGGLSIL